VLNIHVQSPFRVLKTLLKTYKKKKKDLLVVKILRSPVLRGEWDGGSETARKLRGIGREKLKKRTCYVKYSEQKT
jgi:hypothetical protein